MTPEIPSPCEKVCQMNTETGYCVGCLRTLDEIADWLEMTDEQKLELLARLDERRKVLA
jgi:predicted Fe-S protein YdhL (DUF1289 family)